MTLFDLILIAVSLSMDAFAVSICKGLSVRKVSLAHALTCGVWFGGFQFLMPTLGYFLGDRFATLLTKFGPWVAFVLLALIGANITTCLLSAVGVKIGALFGDKYRAPAERIGGIVLILIGIKTLLTGLGVL